jgi:outer membrane protein OmpA-like peptidoglycan-associated protein
LVLEGHASMEGTIGHNLKLSQMRADAVKSMLMLSNVPEENIKSSIGQGETNIFGEILDTNRRVMVLSVD